MTDLTKVLAANVARRRAYLRLSVRDVAKRGGASHQSVLNTESAKGGTTVRTLEMLAAGLGCTPGDLLTEPQCMTCFDAPPPGFTCNACGAGGEAS